MEKKAMPATQKKPGRQAEDSPVAWFAVLEDARNRHDRRQEAEAIRQLDRLGVTVSFTWPAPTREEPAR
jgi:hypothetical protein